MAERAIVDRILSALKKMGAKADKYHGGRFSTAGHPDVYGCYQGRMFLIEVKKPGEKPTDLQKAELVEWALAGARTGHARTVDEALAIARGEYDH